MKVNLPDEIDISDLPKKVPFRSLLIVITTASVLFTIISIYLFITLPKLGDDIGGALGNATGTALGTSKAVADAEKAVREGRDKGVSAEDTEVVIDGVVKGVGNLRVLSANLKFGNYHEGQSYHSLTLKYGKANYSVDLTKYVYDENSNTIHIPDVTVSVDIDENMTEPIAEYSGKGVFTNGKDGMDGFINSENMTTERLKETVKGNDEMRERAREAAKNQVYNLVSPITGDDVKVIGAWEEGEAND